MASDKSKNQVWRISPLGWLVMALVALLLGVVAWDGVDFLLYQWQKPEYGYAYLLPVIVAFLIWQRKDDIERIPFTGDWRGLLLLLFGLAAIWGGTLGAVHAVIQYGLFLAILGSAWAYVGIRVFKLIFMPLLILAFAVPLPGFIHQGLSNELQLISSEIGVAFIRLFDISVYLEGNVIDLGVYKLQVVEACNGLRYLFPLMTLGFIAAYFFKVELWKRLLLFVSTIPITVLMNSFRIGVIGVLVEHWGISMAEGFLHDFEGWMVFMACLGVLLLEMWILSRIGKDSRPLMQVFGIEFPLPTPEDAAVRNRPVPMPAYVALMAVGAMAIYAVTAPERVDVIPEREELVAFPMMIDGWHGAPDRMEQIVMDSLNLDDYLLANYRRDDPAPHVGLYIAYYGIQRADKVPHSPAACLPGGGWAITQRNAHQVNGVEIYRQPLRVNRFIIEQKGTKQLVYYWFLQRGRVIDNEFAVKWHLLVDSVTKHRSDGALVRLTTMISPSESVEEADKRLTQFAASMVPSLDEFIPE